MTDTNSEIGEDAHRLDDAGTGFLFWGWIIVTLLNLGMVSIALTFFAP
ncbi:MAG TPA: hypothetical protein VFR39_02860 [Burkholderiales bacterium]|nr:hypothetical protein [Burkholderiales bacterium]